MIENVSQSVMLVEHDMELNELKKLRNSCERIVTLDVVAHKKLMEEKIPHELIEDYFEEEDIRYMDNLSVEKSTKWHSDEKISKLLEFENIKLGWLLETETFSYMIQIIKKVVGVTRLIDKCPFDQAYCSDFISIIIQNISKKIKISQIPTKIENDFHFENIEIPLKIGRKIIHFRLSRRSTLMIKKIIERSTNLIVHNNLDRQKTKKRILLLDFDIIQYKDLITNLSKYFEVIILNERKPAIWNLQSLQICRKLKCKIIYLDDFKDLSTASEISRSLKDSNQNLDKLFENDDYFNSFFSALDITFWPAIKHNFIKKCKSRTDDSIKRFILSKKLFAEYSIDKILLLYVNGVEEKMIMAAAKTKQIPGIILQHGYLPNVAYLQKYMSLCPVTFDSGYKHGLWGQQSNGTLLNLGIQNENIIMLGSPKHDKFFKAEKTSKKIIFFDSFASEINFETIDSRNIVENESILMKICRKLNSIQSYDFAVKLHPGQHVLPYSIKSVIKQIDEKIPVYQVENSFDLLSNCMLVMAPVSSTILLEAMIMGIPTLVYTADKSQAEESMFASKASILVHSYEDFERNLSKILNDDEFRMNLINKGNEYVKKYFSFPGKSSQTITDLIQNENL